MKIFGRAVKKRVKGLPLAELKKENSMEFKIGDVVRVKHTQKEHIITEYANWGYLNDVMTKKAYILDSKEGAQINYLVTADQIELVSKWMPKDLKEHIKSGKVKKIICNPNSINQVKNIIKECESESSPKPKFKVGDKVYYNEFEYIIDGVNIHIPFTYNIRTRGCWEFINVPEDRLILVQDQPKIDMVVKCVDNEDGGLSLTIGKYYPVKYIHCDSYTVKNDIGLVDGYHPERFKTFKVGDRFKRVYFGDNITIIKFMVLENELWVYYQDYKDGATNKAVISWFAEYFIKIEDEPEKKKPETIKIYSEQGSIIGEGWYIKTDANGVTTCKATLKDCKSSEKKEFEKEQHRKSCDAYLREMDKRIWSLQKESELLPVGTRVRVAKYMSFFIGHEGKVIETMGYHRLVKLDNNLKAWLSVVDLQKLEEPQEELQVGDWVEITNHYYSENVGLTAEIIRIRNDKEINCISNETLFDVKIVGDRYHGFNIDGLLFKHLKKINKPWQPKFKVGDWVRWNNEVRQIHFINGNKSYDLYYGGVTTHFINEECLNIFHPMQELKDKIKSQEITIIDLEEKIMNLEGKKAVDE
jgi:hypothetical protein